MQYENHSCATISYLLSAIISYNTITRSSIPDFFVFTMNGFLVHVLYNVVQEGCTCVRNAEMHQRKNTGHNEH